MITVIDYDAGNIKSVEKALDYLGQKCVVTRDRKLIEQADTMEADTISAFGAKAKDRIRNAYSWQYIADQYENAFLGNTR